MPEKTVLIGLVLMKTSTPLYVGFGVITRGVSAADTLMVRHGHRAAENFDDQTRRAVGIFDHRTRLARRRQLRCITVRQMPGIPSERWEPCVDTPALSVQGCGLDRRPGP